MSAPLPNAVKKGNPNAVNEENPKREKIKVVQNHLKREKRFFYEAWKSMLPVAQAFH